MKYFSIIHFSKIVLLMITIFLIVSCGKQKNKVDQSASLNREKLNIIVIFMDDLDFDELNVYDNDLYPCYTGAHNHGYPISNEGIYFNSSRLYMPNIDKLAREGAVFTRFYTPSSVCTPARYSILTGRYASKSPGFLKQFPANTTANIRWNTPLLPDEPNIAKSMKELGYTTGIIGKWHNELNGKIAITPKSYEDLKDSALSRQIASDYEYIIDYLEDSIGFDHAARICYDNPRVMNLEWVTEGAIEFIDENKSRPFYLYLPLPFPHAQYNKFADWDILATPAGMIDEEPAGQMTFKEACRINRFKLLDKRKSMGTYLDDCVGAICRKLAELDISDNTLIIITSDQQSRGKFTTYESCHIPCIMYCPSLIKAGTSIDELCLLNDIPATAIDLAGGKNPEYYDGKSMKQLMLGKKVEWRNSLLLEIAYSKAVVTKDFKYIALRPPGDIIELLENDAIESNRNKKNRQVGWDGSKNPHPYYDNYGVRYGASLDFPYYFDYDQLYNLSEDIYEQDNVYNNKEYLGIQAELKLELGKLLADFPHNFGEFKTQAETVLIK